MKEARFKRTFKEHSPAAYADVKFVMDMAVNKPGLRYELSTVGAAINFKQRCNKYRNLMRDIATEQVLNAPGFRAETAYDVLIVRQVNAEGKPDRKGTILVFDHQVAEGRLIDPETGKTIEIPNAPPFIRSILDE